MTARLVVRVRPDDRVEVHVEGMTARDSARPKGQKLCEKVTRRLEHDLGTVVGREYDDDGLQTLDSSVSEQEDVDLEGM